MSWKKYGTEKPDNNRWCWLKAQGEEYARPVLSGVIFWAYRANRDSDIHESFWRCNSTDLWQYAEVPE